MPIFNAADINKMEQRYRVNFINSLSGFKSANLIGTSSGKQQSNLAIVSSVVHLGANPPLMAYINRPASVPRHTLDNILETKYYTINHVNQGMIEAAHQTSARYSADESEFKASGLNEYWSDSFAAPFVQESKIKIGLNYVEHHTLLNDTVMVIGEVVYIELEDGLLEGDGLINILTAESVSVSGLDTYNSAVKIKRMAYAKPDRPPSSIS
ncbi:MAG: flavin reductase family protein [Cellvibrionaceae bacterium]